MNRALRETDTPGHIITAGFDLALPRWQAQVLAWFAGLFAQPPAVADIWSYRKGPAGAWLDVLSHADVMAEGMNRLRTVLDAPVSDHDLAAQLGAVYTALFSGAGGARTIAPYESAYNGNGRLFQEPASAMAGLLRRHDVHVAAGLAEAPDHLCVELALLAQLTAAGDADAAPLCHRLARWLPRFAAQCHARDATGFWSGAAQALTGLLAILALNSSPHNPDTGGRNDRYQQA